MKFNFSDALNTRNRIQPGASAKNITIVAIIITFIGAIVNEAAFYISLPFGGVILDPFISQEYEVLTDPLGVLIYLSLVIVFVIGVLITLSSLALPWGYLAETIRLEVQSSDYLMPTWKGNLISFYKRGIMIQSILLVYLIATIFLPLIIIASSATLYAKLSGVAVEQINDPVGVLLLTVIALSMVIFFLIVPAAIVHYAAEGTFLSGFNLIKIARFIFSSLLEYILIYFFYLLMLVLFIIISVLLACTCIGVVLLPYIYYFLIPVTFFNMFAQIYKRLNA